MKSYKERKASTFRDKSQKEQQSTASSNLKQLISSQPELSKKNSSPTKIALVESNIDDILINRDSDK